MTEAVVVAAARSPIGRAGKGSLREMRPDDLGVQMVQAALAQVPELDPASVEDLMLGTASPAGTSGYNLARIVAVLSGLDQVAGVTVNRYCSSSLQTSRMAMHAIKAGEGDVFISAGVETVSQFGLGAADNLPGTRNPLFADAVARTTRIMAGELPWTDPRVEGGLPDVYLRMGMTAENVAELTGVTRADQDAFAVQSQNRAERSIADGFWERDITPVALPDGSLVSQDDCPRPGVTLEGVSALQPAFKENGSVTAGNCTPLNDGAAAVVIMSDTKARELGITPLARIVSSGLSGLSPEIMGLGPVESTTMALQRAGLTMADIDLVEINEAFAAQVVASARQLGVPEDRLNVHGGAIAVGHPFGMTGARITTTLLHALREGDKQFGLETMCVGGGQGMAMVFERLS